MTGFNHAGEAVVAGVEAPRCLAIATRQAQLLTLFRVYLPAWLCQALRLAPDPGPE